MFEKLMGIFKDERGSAFIENALWIVIVVLIVAVAGYALAKEGITDAFEAIEDQVDDRIVDAQEAWE